MTTVEHPVRGAVVLPGWPVHTTGSPSPVITSPPLLGEHTAPVLEHLLGLTLREINKLREEEVV